MIQIRNTLRSFSICLIAFGFVSTTLAVDEVDKPSQIRTQLRRMSDQQLIDRLIHFLSKKDFRDEYEYEACLSEIVRRGKKASVVPLQKQFNTLVKRKVDIYNDPDHTVSGSAFNLELLTALRRIQKKPDPLTILVEREDGPLTATPLALPQLKVSLKNVDIEQKEIGITAGGNYRSGQQARWYVSVVDDKGKMVPIKYPDCVIAILTGGIEATRILKHGESWKTVIDMQSFIESPLPGRYHLQVLYHNTRTILYDYEHELIFCRSEKIPFVVSPTVISMTDKDKLFARKWIADLDPTKKVIVIAGVYGEWAHDTVRPDSPHGKLLSLGLSAAPLLVEALQEKNLSKEKRAWILSLLYSVTGLNAPCEGNALGEYEFIEGPWQVWGGLSDEEPSGGISFGSSFGSIGGEIDLSGEKEEIDVSDQKELTKKWIAWLKTVKIEMK